MYAYYGLISACIVLKSYPCGASLFPTPGEGDRERQGVQMWGEREGKRRLGHRGKQGETERKCERERVMERGGKMQKSFTIGTTYSQIQEPLTILCTTNSIL